MLQRTAQSTDRTDGLPLSQLRAFFQIKGFLFRRNTGQQGLSAGQRRQHQGTVVGNQLLCQALDVHRLLTQLGKLCQRRRTVLRFQRIRNTEQIAAVGHTGHTAHHICVDLCRHAGAGVQNGQRITQCAICQTGDQLGSVRGQLQLFLPCDILHPAGNVLRPDAGKVIPLTAGQNGGRHLLDLGRCQNKDDMGRRLFQCLEQCIEGCCGQHVHLIDNVYLIFTGTGRVSSLIAQVADIIHAVVGGGIHFHHIQNAAVVDAPADLALAAGVAIYRMQAVDRLCKNFSAGGFAGAAHTGEQIGVAHTVCRDLIFQSGDDGPLAHYVFKALGSPLAVQCAIHGLFPLPGKSANKKDSARRGFVPALRNSAYGCRLTETHERTA